jgi:hypothetical protein
MAHSAYNEEINTTPQNVSATERGGVQHGAVSPESIYASDIE